MAKLVEKYEDSEFYEGQIKFRMLKCTRVTQKTLAGAEYTYVGTVNREGVLEGIGRRVYPDTKSAFEGIFIGGKAVDGLHRFKLSSKPEHSSGPIYPEYHK